MIGNKPSFGDSIQWAFDYFVISFNAVTLIETYTYSVNGTYDTATGGYTSGQITGYAYVLYDDANKSNVVSAYYKKA